MLKSELLALMTAALVSETHNYVSALSLARSIYDQLADERQAEAAFSKAHMNEFRRKMAQDFHDAGYDIPKDLAGVAPAGSFIEK